MAFQGFHWEITSSGAVDKILSACRIEVLRRKIHWLTEIGVPLLSKILKEVGMNQFCKMKLNLVLKKYYFSQKQEPHYSQ
jgi:hypothetical protein